VPGSEPRPMSVMPRNLLGRIVVRTLALEWWSFHAVLMTIVAIVCVAFGQWILALFAASIAAFGWGHTIRSEIADRREEYGPNR
jgi:hypothetical protein